MRINGYVIETMADLRDADLRDADLRGVNLQGADLQGVDLRDADLRCADLQGANLQYADLQGANLDFSCWPLWCGSKNVKLDDNQIDQLCLHLVWVWDKAPDSIVIRANQAAERRWVKVK